jgi:hypothetical protein
VSLPRRQYSKCLSSIYLHPCFHSTISHEWLSSQLNPLLTVSLSTDTALFMYKNERCHSPEVSTPSALLPSCCAIFSICENISVVISLQNADTPLSLDYICKCTKRNHRKYGLLSSPFYTNFRKDLFSTKHHLINISLLLVVSYFLSACLFAFILVPSHGFLIQPAIWCQTKLAPSCLTFIPHPPQPPRGRLEKVQ